MSIQREGLRQENLELVKTGKKRCGGCLEILLVERFSRYRKNSGTIKAGALLTRCKECSAGLRRKNQGPRSHWLRMYGLTPEKVRELEDKQNGVCAICEKVPVGIGRLGTWNVDHDHETGKVRGLLCGFCNSGLGYFKDSEASLIRAAKYLREATNVRH